MHNQLELTQDKGSIRLRRLHIWPQERGSVEEDHPQVLGPSFEEAFVPILCPSRFGALALLKQGLEALEESFLRLVGANT